VKIPACAATTGTVTAARSILAVRYLHLRRGLAGDFVRDDRAQLAVQGVDHRRRHAIEGDAGVSRQSGHFSVGPDAQTGERGGAESGAEDGYDLAGCGAA
jgi:hypothetical protein